MKLVNQLKKIDSLYLVGDKFVNVDTIVSWFKDDSKLYVVIYYLNGYDLFRCTNKDEYRFLLDQLYIGLKSRIYGK